MFRLTVLSLIIVGLAAAPAQTGDFNKKLKIGDPAPNFTGLEGTDGKTYSLDSFKNKDVLVICVTCNHCPVATAYEDRIIRFAKHTLVGNQFAVVAINVNNLEADRLPQMKERAKAKGFNFPYLYDPSQKMGRDLGATVTPEFFVFDKERKLVYQGAYDDSQDNPQTYYVSQAVVAALKGEKPKTQETQPRGCSVKYDKE